MQLAKGDMFDYDCDLVLVTTNSTLTKDGKLVMGAGAAKKARDYCHGIDAWAGKFLSDNSLNTYGVIITPFLFPSSFSPRVGFFQTKDDWRESSRLGLVIDSTDQLIKIAPGFLTIHLNFPGIGHGGLRRETVLPIIERLPDNVYVFEK